MILCTPKIDVNLHNLLDNSCNMHTHNSSLSACEFEDAHVQPCIQVMRILDWQYVILSIEYIIIIICTHAAGHIFVHMC